MRIPEVQARLRKLAERGSLYHVADELNLLADELSRRKGEKGPPVSRKVTDEVKAEIWELRNTTGMSQMQIAQAVGVNTGRVSEVLKGFRT